MARAKTLLQEIENYAQNIGDTIPDPLLILDRDLRVKSANRAFYKTFQVSPEETEGQLLSELGERQWNIPHLLTLLREIVPTKSHFDDFEVAHDFPKIGGRIIILNARKLYRPGNRTVLLALGMEDITERKQAEDIIIVSEQRYRRLFETARDGILILDADEGKITDANPYMTELLGYPYDDLLGKELWEIGLLQDKKASQEAFRQLEQEGYIRYDDLPLENQRGERREVEFVSNLYRENGHTVIQCNIRDITERKRTEVDLAAAATKHGRQAAVLDERTRMAQEIHDTLAQGFTGITTQLEAAEAALAKVTDPSSSPASLAAYQVQLGKVQTRIGKARDLARDSLAEARRSVAGLRSPPLEVAPLSEALPRLLAERLIGTAVKSRFILEGVPHSLPGSIEHCLLRIGQEAIANAVNHAQPQEIDMILSFEVGQARLRVRDDGRGFALPLPGAKPEAGQFGIIGMRERAEKVGGELTIISQPGDGTEVRLIVPIHEAVITGQSRETG